MSYVQEVVAVKETVLEYRWTDVPTGDTAPIPEEGYQIQRVFTNIAGKDIYIEYKTFERDHICPS